MTATEKQAEFEKLMEQMAEALSRKAEKEKFPLPFIQEKLESSGYTVKIEIIKNQK